MRRCRIQGCVGVLLLHSLHNSNFKIINKMTSLPLTTFMSCEHADKCLLTKKPSKRLPGHFDS